MGYEQKIFCNPGKEKRCSINGPFWYKRRKRFSFRIDTNFNTFCTPHRQHFCIDELMNFCAKNIFYGFEAYTEINTIYPLCKTRQIFASVYS